MVTLFYVDVLLNVVNSLVPCVVMHYVMHGKHCSDARNDVLSLIFIVGVFQVVNLMDCQKMCAV